MKNRITGKAFLSALFLAAFFAVPPGAVFGQNFWTGTGGAGLSIAVLAPEGRGLAATEAYLPTMVQGVLVGDLAKFSAMQALDRQNLEKVIAERESGYYADESNFVQLGTVANVQYILNGALQKTGSGFSLQLKITDAASGASKAAYTGNVPATELEDLTGVKKASADLLAQLGVTLTDAGKTSLLGAAGSNAAAETALAKGITAQQSGAIVEALSYYYEAAKFDPGLAEAASRSSVLLADITGGNIGANVRNDIQTRAAWNKTFQEAAAFFKEHPPFELIYDTALTTGKIDYDKETAEISFKTKLISTTGFKIIYDLDQGLEKTGRKKDWGISMDSIYRAIPGSYEFSAVLVNEKGETIGRTTAKFEPRNTDYGSFRFNFDFSHNDTTVVFSNVDANKITDKLTVSIVSVNGMDEKVAGEQGFISVSSEDFTVWDAPGFQPGWRFGDMIIAKYKGDNKEVAIPAKISRQPVVSIGDRAFRENQLTSVSLPNSVTSIGNEAFYGNQLTSVIIPNSVTSIGNEAFTHNQLTSVTLPNSVTSIEGSAFSNNQLASITIPNSVTFIGDRAFRENQLTSVTIPNSVISIEEEAFFGNRLTSVTLPNSVTSIGRHAFSKNELTSVIIPNSVTSIEDFAFSANGLLTSVTLPNNVKLGYDAIPCQRAYDANGKKAGTYVLVNRTWTLKK
jgi:TolB-like protein